MEPTVQTIVILVGGVLARFSLLIVVIALLAIPVLLGLGMRAGFLRLRDRVLGVVHGNGVVWTTSAYYAPGHTWVRRTRKNGLRVGLDDVVQRLFARADRVELPPPGTAVRAGDVAGVIHCADKRAEIRAPIDGTITAVNDAVVRKPSLIHIDPYARGWLFAVAPSGGGLTRLLHGDLAVAWLEREAARLTRFVEHDLGMAAADGGEIVAPAPSLLTGEQWTALTRAFLSPN